MKSGEIKYIFYRHAITVVKNVKSGEININRRLRTIQYIILVYYISHEVSIEHTKIFIWLQCSNYDVTMMLSKTINDVLYL